MIPENYVDENGFKHVGHRNPFRYRGYFYDTEIGLYYLQSRYYDPETGRFINADTVEYLDPKAINGLNLYAYCGNNPVMNVDPSGHLPHIVIALLIVAAVLIVAGGIWGGTSAAMAGGGTLDILAGIGKGMMIGAILGAGVALTVASFYVSGGATGVLGAIMLPYGTSLLFNVAEISGFQAHKSSARGSGFWQTSNDIVNAVFANTARIFFGVDSFLDGFIIGGKVFSNAPTFSKYTDELIELSSSWKFSRAAAIATNSILAAPASLISKGLMAFEILKQAKSAVFAIAGISDPDESGWILY